mgnify:CR=1 FL=1
MSNIDNILLNIKELNYNNSIPNRTVRDKLINYVEKFLSKTKRKIYGGTAINKFVKIYDDFEEPDYDVYTPQPKKDAIDLAHYLFDLGIKDTAVSRGVTKGTFKVFAYKLEAVDFSFMPEKMYNLIPFTKINNLYYTSPEYLRIDLLLAIVNPQKSIYLWEKTLPRYLKLKNKFKIKEVKYENKTIFNQNAINLINKIIKNNIDVVVTGITAYRILVLKSNIKHIYLPNISFLEVLTVKPVKLLKKIIEIYGIDNIIIKHFNQFLKIIPSKFVVYYKNQRLINIYYLEDKCFPFIRLDDMLISSYDYLELYFNALIYQYKIINNKNLKNFSKCILFNLDKCRNLYLKKKGSNIIDDKLLQLLNASPRSMGVYCLYM